MTRSPAVDAADIRVATAASLRIRTRGNALAGSGRTRRMECLCRRPPHRRRPARRRHADLRVRRRRTTRFLLAFLGLIRGFAIGARFTGPGVSSEWYQTLARAPWTPDGWASARPDPHHGHVLGLHVALMVADRILDRPILAIAYAKALAFNIAWNPLFFGARLTGWAMLDLVLLLAVVLWLWHRGWNQPDMVRSRWLMLPYPCWLLVAMIMPTPLHRRVTFSAEHAAATERPRWPTGTWRCRRRESTGVRSGNSPFRRATKVSIITSPT